MNINQVMDSVGLNEGESRGTAFLAGMCSAVGHSKQELVRKIEVFSSVKSEQELEQEFGSVRDAQIQLDIEDFLALVGDEFRYRKIQISGTNFQIYTPQIRKRLRTSNFDQSVWDCQLLYSQLSSGISRHLPKGPDLAMPFDNGLFYHLSHHTPDRAGGVNAISTIAGYCPPIIKGLLSIDQFQVNQRDKLTGLHVTLLGFTLGLDQRVAEILWMALSFVLYEHGGELHDQIESFSPEKYYLYCVDGVRRFANAQPRHMEVLRGSLAFSSDPQVQVLNDYESMETFISQEWPGGENLALKCPDQYEIMLKTFVFYESVKAYVQKLACDPASRLRIP